MNADVKRKRVKKKTDAAVVAAPVMSERELAALGGGHIAYVKQLSPDEASALFPLMQTLPKGIDLFSLHSADGTPIALADSRQAAIGHAIEDELEVSSVH